MRVAVAGVGSIGTVLARGFDALGHDVKVNDIDDEQTAKLPYPAAEKPVLSDWAEIVFIAVPTPTTGTGGDPSIVASAVSPFEDTEATVVIRSTMPPGTTTALADEFDLPLVYSPEFLRERSGLADFMAPDRIVITGPAAQRRVLRDVLSVDDIQCSQFFESDDYLPAELAKEAHNAFFATKVSFANQMRAIAESVGADPEFVMDVVTADARNTTSHLDPMLGPYGGTCLPKDTEALRLFARRHDVDTPVLDGTVSMNQLARAMYDAVEIGGHWPDLTVVSD